MGAGRTRQRPLRRKHVQLELKATVATTTTDPITPGNGQETAGRGTTNPDHARLLRGGVGSEGVVVERSGVRVEREVVGLEVDDGGAVAGEDAVHEPVRLDRQGELVHARLDVERLRVARRARQRQLPVRRGEDHSPHLVLELQ